MPKLKIGDIHTYYEIHGQGEPLVFIHGLGSSGRDWEFQLPFFTPHFQVITYDARGHGQTDKPPGPYNIPMFTDDLAGLLKALEIPKAHIVGISMGGNIAFQMSVSYPALVKSQTIVNSSVEYVPQNFRERMVIFQRLVLFRAFSMRKIGETLSKRLFIKPEQEDLRQMFVDRWSENHKPSYIAATRGLFGWSVRNKLGEIACPTLIMAADEDYTPVSTKETYAALVQNAELVVIEDSCHATPVEKPEVFNEVLFDFLQSVS
jgi:pimeloyl-ACP methyl ester carboxylesterase